MTAMPSEPPTWREQLSTAEPTPALSTATAPIAAAVVGVIASAIPRPPVSRPGRMSQNVEPTSSCAKSTSDSETSVMPAPTSHRDPTCRSSCPASGATRMISTVIGRKTAPVCVAE